MSKVKRLLQNYSRHIAIPWREVAAAQRVIFCVYDPKDELHLRAIIGEFELETQRYGHPWKQFDLTDAFSNWMTTQRYAESYFKKPEVLTTLLPSFNKYIADQFKVFLESNAVGEESVVALTGVGSLFGFLKVKEVVDALAPMVKGRLLVFFPGSYEGNNYRLLDGYDGWNYLAVPILADIE